MKGATVVIGGGTSKPVVREGQAGVMQSSIERGGASTS